MRFPEEVLRKRLKAFQEKFSSKGIDCVMLRTLSSYAYFTGIKWLRPALFIPSDGDPIAFIVRGEEHGFMEKTWIRNIITFIDGADLMAKVTRTIRDYGAKRVGLEFGVEKDAYILFYEMFKKLNPKVEVIDIGPILAEMRIIKDNYELNAIREAGKKASRAMERVLEIIKPGISETEIVAEAYSALYKLGAEAPHVYVNVGPHPRVHCEPFRDIVVKKNLFVMIVIGADHNGYYTNMTRTVFVGNKLSNVAKKILKCTEEVYRTAINLTRPGKKFIEVINALDKVYGKYELKDKRVIGYVHGVGLQIEETPITTIIPTHRYLEIKPRMVLAMVHAPIMYEGLGQVKREDTFIVKEDGELEQVTF